MKSRLTSTVMLVWSCDLVVVDISQNTGISLQHVTQTLNTLKLASNKDTGSVILLLTHL